MSGEVWSFWWLSTLCYFGCTQLTRYSLADVDCAVH
nr:MAG TPA: hypothetical protein [Caudoviricetes sp.]